MKTPTLNGIKPPPNLSKEAQTWWSGIRKEYDITDTGGLVILAAAAEAFCRMREAQEVLRREGLTVLDRHKQQRAHPCTTIERDARGQMLAALRQLNLDLEPLRDRPGRPAGSRATLRAV